ncbi:hypothetical protein D1007_17198 [Hordeum vulgare]|nr:hypothetical protein D1007_17198 [Hordeum vulgare]
MNEASPDCFDNDGDGSGGSLGPPGTPTITSRLSLLKVGAVISKFSDFKKELVRETGFDGLLHIKSWQKINLKYSAYLMDRVDVENSIINLESQGMLELTDNQVHYVFGIPIGEHTILSEGVEPSDACVEFTRVAAGISDKGSYSGNSSNARKRNCVMGSSNATESQKKICVSPNEPIQVRTPSGIDILNNSSISAKDGAHNQVADIVYSFFDDLTACIVSYYAELRPSSNYITFGTTNDVVPRTTFLAWNFDGEKFQIPVTKDNLERHKNWLLYEVMRTDGNESMIPSDAIEAIKGSFLAL